MPRPVILLFKHDSPPPRRVLSASCLLSPSNTHCLPPPQTVSTASELRKPIYWIVAAKAIDYEQMLLLMAGVKWDIREIMSQHNVYVDVLLKVMGGWVCVGGVTGSSCGGEFMFSCVNVSASPRR